MFGKTRAVADLQSDDFEELRQDISKTRGPVGLANEIGRVRVALKHAYDASLIDRPVRTGAGFVKPSKRVLRIARQVNGSKMFEPAEIRALLDRANTQIKAMILLAINCGFGNSDIGRLPISAVDLERGWIIFPRPKTAVERRNLIWDRTVQALRDVLASRPNPVGEEAEGKVFVTKYGQAWVKAGDAENPRTANPISAEFRKLSQSCGVYKKGRSYYSLRHTFRTVGEEAGETATRYLMGHADHSMSGVYRERISDERLRAVTDHIHKWLWPDSEGGES